MQEAFLHYLWKYKKFRWNGAKITTNKEVVLIDGGRHNEEESGPDFFNAKLKIDDQIWAGNVEIHLKASDWYAHQHETDPAYDNVILHVVWENDAEIFRKDNSIIPTLELQQLVESETLCNYHNLLENDNSRWIGCEKDFVTFGDFEMNNWLERMYVERLEQKSEMILSLLGKSTNNWEAVLFKMLAKNFGLNVNGDAFLDMANSIPFSIVQKLAKYPLQLEALFFGQAGMLEEEIEDPYFLHLKKEYVFLQQKFSLECANNTPIKFFRLRPDNFPSIRLAQLASLYAKEENLFSKVVTSNNQKELYDLLKTRPSGFWQTHYTFQKESKKRAKSLTKNFMDLLLINTIVPIKFCYFKTIGKQPEQEVLKWMKDLKAESNAVVNKFNKIRSETARNAMESQALIYLKKNYCDNKRCLQCALGLKLLQES